MADSDSDDELIPQTRMVKESTIMSIHDFYNKYTADLEKEENEFLDRLDQLDIDQEWKKFKPRSKDEAMAIVYHQVKTGKRWHSLIDDHRHWDIFANEMIRETLQQWGLDSYWRKRAFVFQKCQKKPPCCGETTLWIADYEKEDLMLVIPSKVGSHLHEKEFPITGLMHWCFLSFDTMEEEATPNDSDM